MQTRRLLVAMNTSPSRAGAGRGERGHLIILVRRTRVALAGYRADGIDPTSRLRNGSGSPRRRRLGFGEIAGPPQIPAGHGPERSPALAALDDHIRLGKVARFD